MVLGGHNRNIVRSGFELARRGTDHRRRALLALHAVDVSDALVAALLIAAADQGRDARTIVEANGFRLQLANISLVRLHAAATLSAITRGGTRRVALSKSAQQR
jgi:hypothetical protein